MQSMDLSEIVDGLKKPGKSKKGLAQALGRQPSAVTALLQGEREIKAREIPLIRAYLELDGARAVPLVGYVGAGAEAHYYDRQQQDELDRVPAPDDTAAETVAVEIRGESLGALFDRWLVYYDEVHRPVSPELIGKLCVVGLADGRVLIKKIQRSKAKGLFHLISNTEAPLTDIAIDWAAPVKSMQPR
ncbi:MAG: XRE family transcriptional regulator [Xanthobacteraceae bacterium]|nr:XRE family transcriptional regulator [Xanthobacteraceae bacterium]